MVKGDLERIRNHIEWQQADVVARGQYNEERLAVLSVLSQNNHILEKFLSDDDEKDLNEQYNKLRQNFLEWYEVINTEADKNQKILILIEFFFQRKRT